jgi:hypothetical protein
MEKKKSQIFSFPFRKNPLKTDLSFTKIATPIMISCAYILLVFSQALWYTLKWTHLTYFGFNSWGWNRSEDRYT